MGTPKYLKKTEKKQLPSVVRWLLPVAVCFLELLFHIWVGGSISVSAILTLVGFSLLLGGLLNLIAVALPPKGCKWTSALLIFLFAVIMMVELLVPLCAPPEF